MPVYPPATKQAMEQLPVGPTTRPSRDQLFAGPRPRWKMPEWDDEKKKKGPEAEFTVLAFRAASHNMGARRARRACTPPVWPRR